MPLAALSSTMLLRDVYGPVAPTGLAAPVRQGLAKYGDGLFLEEATTNILTNPLSGGAALSPWASSGAGATQAVDTTTFGGTFTAKLVKGASTNVFAHPGLTFTAGQGYAFAIDVWVPAGYDFTSGTPYVDFVSTAAAVDSANIAVDTTKTNQWQRVITTLPTVTAATDYQVRVVMPGTGSGTIWVRRAQAEQKGTAAPYATSFAAGDLGAGYAWTGVANASTSTRAAGVAVYSRTTTPPLTVACWVKLGSILPATRAALSLLGSGTNPTLVFTATNVQWSSNVDVASTVSYTSAPGDLVFLAGVLAADGKTFTAYAAVNGGAVVAGTPATSGTAFTAPTSIYLGSLPASNTQLNGVLEQVLVFNRALSAAEIAALAARVDEATYETDTGIAFAAATGVVRGSTNAATSAGTGSYRTARSVPASLEPITRNAASPDDDASTFKATVAAGAGVAAGQIVTFDASPLAPRFVVNRAFTPGGAFDELYLSESIA